MHAPFPKHRLVREVWSERSVQNPKDDKADDGS